MFAGSLLTITISLFILYFGIYVYRIDLKKRIQTYFLLLSVALSLWMGGLGLRSFFPLTYREIFLNWILFPVVYIPFFLDLVVCSLMRKKFKFNFYRVVSVFCDFAYFFTDFTFRRLCKTKRSYTLYVFTVYQLSFIHFLYYCFGSP